MNGRAEKLGPMHWRIHVDGREPFDYWTYVLVDADGVEHRESFSFNVQGARP
jgi:hypothetical protein